MYASRATCSRCASQLRPAQAQALGGAVLFSSWSEAASTTPSRSPSAQGRKDRRDTGHAPGPTKWTGHDRHLNKRWTRKESDKSALAMFNEVVRPGLHHHASKSSSSSSSPTETQLLAILKEIADPRNRLLPEDRVQSFNQGIRPHLQGQPFGLADNILALVTGFLKETCDEMLRKGTSAVAIELSEIGSSYGNFETSWRNQLVLNICSALLHQEESQRSREISQRLIDMWTHISHQARMSTLKAALPQFVLPTVEEVLRDIGLPKTTDISHQGTNLPTAVQNLTSIFPQFPPKEAQKLIPGLLATIAILSDPKFAPREIQMKAAPVLNLVAAVLKDCQITEPFPLSIFQEGSVFPKTKLSELQSYINDRWPNVMTMLYKNDALWRKGLNFTKPSYPPSVGTIEVLREQLKKAHAARNLGGISNLWHRLNTRVQSDPDFAEQLSASTEFLDEWIFVWCAIRGGKRVQETLDLMQRCGLRPTIRTYTNMMHGWKICKERDKIEALWEKLEKSGVKLDAHIWTERISSLIEMDKPQAGIQALAKMQGLWKAAEARGAPHTAIQPTIHVVNAAFKGLMSLDRRAAFELLAWAGREQIEPDVRTYNILLQHSFRNDPPDDIQNLLKAMNQQGIDPDEATFTIILEGVLKTVISASATEQVEAVQFVLDEMKLSGLRPNDQTYGKMLHAVANFATETIDTVLEDMRKNGLPITPHMVTILIERYLRNRAPDGQEGTLAVIQKLLGAHGFTDISKGDQTLWERVVSAYAVLGDTAGALAIFDNLAEVGRPVTSLICLLDLLVALLAKKEVDAARKVVQAVLAYKIRNSEGPNDARFWFHQFWHLAREHRLFNAEDIPLQIRTWMEEWRMSRKR